MTVFARIFILAGYAVVLHIPPVFAQTKFTKSFYTKLGTGYKPGV